MKSTTKTKKTQTKGATIPENIKALYDQEAYDRDVLDIPRKAQWFKDAINGKLPEDEQRKAYQEFSDLLYRMSRCPVWSAYFVERVITTFLLADTYRKESDRQHEGWDAIHKDIPSNRAERRGTLYGKWLDSYTVPDEVKETVAKIEKGEI